MVGVEYRARDNGLHRLAAFRRGRGQIGREARVHANFIQRRSQSTGRGLCRAQGQLRGAVELRDDSAALPYALRMVRKLAIEQPESAVLLPGCKHSVAGLSKLRTCRIHRLLHKRRPFAAGRKPDEGGISNSAMRFHRVRFAGAARRAHFIEDHNGFMERRDVTVEVRLQAKVPVRGDKTLHMTGHSATGGKNEAVDEVDRIGQSGGYRRADAHVSGATHPQMKRNSSRQHRGYGRLPARKGRNQEKCEERAAKVRSPVVEKHLS